MSQIIKNLSAGPVPPAVPTQFQTDVNSPSIPVANLEKVFGGQVTTNNTNGVQTDGSSGGNTLTIQLTNRITGSATTTDGTTITTVYTFGLGAAPATYLFTARLAVINLTDNLAAAYYANAAVRTTGAAGSLISTGNYFTSEEGAMSGIVIGNEVVGNNLLLVVTGLAGKTIHYQALTEYLFVS